MQQPVDISRSRQFVRSAVLPPAPPRMRSTGDGKGVSLSPPLVMTLERSLEYIAPDEYVEVTPKSLRLRKKILDANGRKRASTKIG